MASSSNEITPTQAAAALQRALASDLPTFLWGAPGIGKSDLVAQAAEAKHWSLIDLRVTLLDPVDLRGLPTIENGKSVWLPLGELPDEKRDGQNGILLLDELNAAPPSTQAACYQLILNRRLGTYKMPEGWRIVAAGNRQTDRAAAQRMPSALANRFLHLHVTPDMISWAEWATRVGVAPVVVAFIRFRPKLLHSFNVDHLENPTPRSWAMVSQYVQTKGAEAKPDVEIAILHGLVGPAAGSEFLGFLRLWRQLPDPASVLSDPQSAPVPNDVATKFAVLSALAQIVDRQTFPALLDYTDRFPADYRVIAVKDAVRRHPDLMKTPDFTAWASRNQKVVL